VLLPVPGDETDAGRAAAAAAVVPRLDALVVTGGPDVSPAAYRSEPDPRTRDSRPTRDAWELALLDAVAPTRLPVLGICRGMQLVAVHAGGVLDQHVPDLVGHDGHRPSASGFGTTPVEVLAESRLEGLVGPRIDVPCHHHQSVRTHPGLDAVARAEDGLLEALERPGDRFWLAVQWHPEQGDDVRLLSGLVAAARTEAAWR
jgi:putative glutamine amidotransferase